MIARLSPHAPGTLAPAQRSARHPAFHVVAHGHPDILWPACSHLQRVYKHRFEPLRQGMSPLYELRLADQLQIGT